MPPIELKKHKVFISFHHKDEDYKTAFEATFADHFISKSVQNGDIDPDNQDDYVKRLIQEDYISDSSIVIVMYGSQTHERKHVDWEISAALNAKVNGYSGMIVLLLPTFPISPFNEAGTYDETKLYDYLHPRTVANIKSGYAKVYFWPNTYPNLPSVPIPDVLQDAFDRRISHSYLIDNSDTQYKYNR